MNPLESTLRRTKGSPRKGRIHWGLRRSITLGTLGPGKWSLDHAFDFAFPFDPGKALLITAIVGIGGAAVFLATFWRPPKQDRPAA